MESGERRLVMLVLVAHGSKMGGTHGLAEMVADSLRAEGFDCEVRPAGEVRDLDPYDVVVVGGALYAFRWHRDARRFVKRHTGALRRLPTYFFSSGPLDDSAPTKDIPPVRGVQRLMGRVGARGHVTFGGRMPADATGFPASTMAKNNAGDWRDPDHVRAWVRSIVGELRVQYPEAA
jgi:menaquinone-dependent protoporphyrinogen oxidase